MAENEVVFPYGWRYEVPWWHHLFMGAMLAVLVGGMILLAEWAQPQPTVCWTHGNAQHCAWVE